MSLHKDPELKEAILQLSSREKDKLLVRLIGKDKLLMKQLHFQLLEDQDDLALRIDTLREKLQELSSPQQTGIKNTGTFSNYSALTALLRRQSGMINEHEKVTKDKFSEVEFRLLILHMAFRNYASLFDKSTMTSAGKLHRYTAARLKTVQAKYDKLHEDLQFDLQDIFNEVYNFAISKDLV